MSKPLDSAQNSCVQCLPCVMESAWIGAVILSVLLGIVMYRLSDQKFKPHVIAGPVMLSLAIVSIAFAFVGDKTSRWHWAITSFWALGPPFYFLIEYALLGRFRESPSPSATLPEGEGSKTGVETSGDTALRNINKTEFEYLKYSQGLASKCWAGVVALLVVIYQSKK